MTTPENFEEMEFGHDPGSARKCFICEEQKKKKEEVRTMIENYKATIDPDENPAVDEEYKGIPGTLFFIFGGAAFVFWLGVSVGFFVWGLK